MQVSRGFTELKACNYTATAGQTAHHFRETVTELGRIKQMLFGGFARCLYPLQKFDSDTERRFAVNWTGMNAAAGRAWAATPGTLRATSS